MHRNLRATQENCLWHSVILRSLDVARESAGPLIGSLGPIWRWVQGERSRRAGVQVRRKADVSGRCGRRVTAQTVSRRVSPRRWPLGDAGCLPRQRCGAGSGARSSGCGFRLVAERREGVCAGPDPSPGSCSHRGRRRPARTPQAMGASPSAREPGSRQRLHERRQRRSQERSGASLLLLRAKARSACARGGRQRFAQQTARARTVRTSGVDPAHLCLPACGLPRRALCARAGARLGRTRCARSLGRYASSPRH